MVQKVELYLSKLSLKEKPDSDMVKKVSNSMLKSPLELTLKNFAEEHTLRGRTAVLSKLPVDTKKLNKDTPIVSQQVVMLDFDNKESDNLFTIEDFNKDTFLQKSCSFWYKTFSDKESKHDRFRVVLILDTKIRSNREIDVIYTKLFNLYPQADTSCAETTRMFFGSTDGYHVVNWHNRLDVSHLLSLKMVIEDKKNRAFPTTRMTQKVKDIKLSTNTLSIPDDRPVWQLLSDTKDNFNFITKKELKDLDTDEKVKAVVDLRKKAIIKQKVGSTYAMNFNNKASALMHFKQNIDMVEFLGLPKSNFFRDIFHEDTQPSANVFVSNNDEYLYKCFSKSHQFLGNIVNVVGKLTNKNYLASLDLMLDLTGSRIIPDTHIAAVKSDVDIFEDTFISDSFQTSFPYTYKLTHLYKLEIIHLMSAFSKKDIEDLDGNRRVISFFSLETLQKNIYNRLGYNIKLGKLSKIINIMSVLGLMNKLSEEEIPQHLLKSLKEQKRIKQTKNHSDVYELVPFKQEFFENLEYMSKQCLDNNIRVTTISFEMLIRTFGLDFAKKVYTQNSLKDTTGTGTPISKKSVAVENKATVFILKKLESDGYVFEKDILRAIFHTAGSKEKSNYYWKQMRHDVANKYGLTRASFTKDLKERFNNDMPNTLHPIVYFKDE